MTEFFSHHMPAFFALAVQIKHVFTVTELLKIALTVICTIGGAVYAVGLSQGEMRRDIGWIKERIVEHEKKISEIGQKQEAVIGERGARLNSLAENAMKHETALRELDTRLRVVEKRK